MLGNNYVELQLMTRELCHELYKSWENDDSIYMDMSMFKEYVYNKDSVDRYFDSKQETSRKIFAIMLGDRPIGEIQLKQINLVKRECTLSIHMQNDNYKGKGYGIQAEKLAIKYAFDELGMVAVNADTVVKNIRSQHILDKIGFKFLKEEGGFRYYRLEKRK
jgi:RimJ/RimL family protein N-acetyltransferase